MTSGYNVAKNIYLEPELNDLCGFTEPEIASVLTLLASDGADWSHAEALDTMRTFYNGYRFSEDAEARIYNPTLSLHLLEHLDKRGRYPRRMFDENLAMDRAKLDKAEAQARRYGAALRERYGLTDLRAFAVVGIGHERLVWRAVDAAMVDEPRST